MRDLIPRAAVLEILRTPAASDTFPDMIRRVEALEGCGVRVKALNFMRDDYGLITEDARYIVAKAFDAWRVWFHSDPLRDERGRPINYADEQESVSAANEHNRARILAALEPVAQPETPTPGQFTTMCLAIEDVVTGRGFDVAIPEEVRAYLRNALMVGGWRGES